MLTKRVCIQAAILLIAIVFCPFPFGTALGKTLSIDIRDSVVDIEAHEMTIAGILQALAEKTGLSLNLGKPLTEAISCDLKKVTIEEAVHRLLANHDHALTYRKTYDGRLLPDELFVVRADASRRSFSPSAVDKVGMPAENPHPNRYVNMAWFRQQFREAGKLSGQLAATFFYDGSGLGNILVTGISEESPLIAIGLRVGDVIRNVNGKTVNSAQEFLQHLSSLPDDINFARIERSNRAYPLYLYLE
jgi:hypothetical protein